MLKLKQTNIDESISIKDMRVGQIGIIVKWNDYNINLGQIVIKTRQELVNLTDGDTWYKEIFKDPEIENFRVKILQNGTELIICNNE